jgi:hypothetical protein
MRRTPRKRDARESYESIKELLKIIRNDYFIDETCQG